MIFDTVLVGYTSSHTLSALKVCNSLLRFQHTGRRVLVLNNAAIEPVAEGRAARHWEVIKGSNKFGEFSGWQEGLDHIGRTGRGAFFANDSLTVHRKFTWARLAALKRTLRATEAPAIVGFRDSADGELAINGLKFGSWVRTFCFGLTPEALERLNYQICDAHVASKCVNEGLSEERFFSHLSPALDARLRHNLFGGGWYASEPLSRQSVARLSFKARCIVLEKWLAARCTALEIEAIDPFRVHPFAEQLDKAQSRPFRPAVSGLLRTILRRLGRVAE